LPFPFKLHEILTNVANNGTDDIVSWQPHGKAFRVHKSKEFSETIMPTFFRQTRYKSFQRQLHIYGFHRILTGTDKGSYWHPMFIRGMESFSLRMTRCKIKGDMAKSVVLDPNFYQKESCTSSTHGDVAVSWNDLVTAAPSFGDDDDVLVAASMESAPDQATSTLFETSLFDNNASSSSTKILSVRNDYYRSPFPLPAEILLGETTTTCAQQRTINANNIMLLLSAEFEPRPLSLSTNIKNSRRGSIFGAGEECIFAGRKFFIVPNTTSLLPFPTAV
jgi:HSF-type DNA-binding